MDLGSLRVVEGGLAMPNGLMHRKGVSAACSYEL